MLRVYIFLKKMDHPLWLEKKVLFDYLRNGLSTRQLCRKYPEIRDPTGFRSHYILKKFKLKKGDKGSLFLFSSREAFRAIKEVISKGRSILDFLEEPKRFKKYRETFVIAKNEEALYFLVNGEVRNLVQSFFRGRKKQYGICQYIGFSSKTIETAHNHKRGRKKLFKIAASRNRTKKGPVFLFNMHGAIIDFLKLHKKGVVIFLCKKHHREYHLAENKRGFLRNVNQ